MRFQLQSEESKTDNNKIEKLLIMVFGGKVLSQSEIKLLPKSIKNIR
jgi:hypothetical protein